MQTAAALAIVFAALAYLAVRVVAIARGNRCGGSCGAGAGCPAIKEALELPER